MENWFGKRLNMEESEMPKFYNETWVIYFEDASYCPIICANVEHALDVYHQCIKVIDGGWLTYEQVCQDDLGYENNLLDKTHFLLNCMGVCGIPLPLTDKDFWEYAVSQNHILV